MSDNLRLSSAGPSPAWQDKVFAAGGLLFMVALLPSALDPATRVPFISAALTAAVLAVFAATQATLKLRWGATVQFALAWLWAFIAAFRSF